MLNGEPVDKVNLVTNEMERNDDDPSGIAMTDETKDRSSKNSSNFELSGLSSSKDSRSRGTVKPRENNVEVTPEMRTEGAIQMSEVPVDKMVVDDKNVAADGTSVRRKLKSTCRSRSRDPLKCQPHFRQMIDKREMRNEELEQIEGDLRERLNVLQCSMPAVMVWNILRMTREAPPSVVKRLIEKQFEGIQAVDSTGMTTSPSRHYDCRVREIEAERKEAARRADEARALLTEKEAVIEARRKLLDEARRCNQEKREQMERMNLEAAKLRAETKNARGDDRSCETGECGEIRCKEHFLDDVGSMSSISSTDLQCFAKLQELAESEVCMRRQISELERREEAYMRTLQGADELWSNMEVGNAVVGDTAELQEQLKLKNVANQQLADRVCQLEDELEKLKKRLIGCKEELDKFTEIVQTDAKSGFDDGEVGVADREIVAATHTAAASASARPETVHVEMTAHPETMDKESSIAADIVDQGVDVHTKMFDKDSEAIVDTEERAIDTPIGLGTNVAIGDSKIDEPEDTRSIASNRSRPESHEPTRITTDDREDEEAVPENWDWDEGCPPDVICGDPVEIPTPVDDARSMQSIGAREPQHRSKIDQQVKIQTEVALSRSEDIVIQKKTDETIPGDDQITLSREELRNWYNIVDSVRHTISKCENCSPQTKAVAQLADKMRNKLWSKAFAGLEEIMIDEDSRVSLTAEAEILRDLDVEAETHRPSAPLPTPAKIPPDVRSDTSLDLDGLDEKVDPGHKELSDENKDTTDISEKLLVDESDEPPGVDVSDALVSMDIDGEVMEPSALTSVDIDGRVTEPSATQMHDGQESSVTSTDDLKIMDGSDALADLEDVSIIHDKVRSEEDMPEELEPDGKELADQLAESLEAEEHETEESAQVVKTLIGPKDDDELEEMADSLVVTMTPPSTEVDVQLEPEEPAESLHDEIEEEKMTSSVDIPLVSISESIVDTEKIHSTKDDAQEIISGIVEDVLAGLPEPTKETEQKKPSATLVPETKLEEPSVTIVPESVDKEPSTTIVPEVERSDLVVPTVVEAEETVQLELMPEVSEVQSSDKVVEDRAEKLLEKTAAEEEKPTAVSEQATVDVPHLSPAKVVSVEKVRPPAMAVDVCLCKAPFSISLGGRARERENTEGTQTSPQIPRTLDRLRLKTVTDGGWRTPDVVMWRRPLIRSRRLKDKSTLTTVSVDTQTDDSALAREKITQRGIDRKDDCTCSGVYPRKTKFDDGCHERASPRQTDERLPPAPVGLAVGELFGLSRLRPSSMISKTEKEISVTTFTGRSLPADDGEFRCIECGKSITPGETPPSMKASVASSTKTQKSLVETMKKIASASISRMARRKDDFTCCECKSRDKTRTKHDSVEKREADEALDQRTCTEKVCCPCPSRVEEKIATESSKRKKKKRKPEKKDQSVTANIPRNKLKKNSEERTINVEPTTSSVAKKKMAESSDECCASSQVVPKIASALSEKHSQSSRADRNGEKSKTKTSADKLETKVSIAKESSKCGCGEDSAMHVPYMKYSSIFKTKFHDGSSIESVSKEDCNCADEEK